MILVDTSIWIDHLRHTSPQLASLVRMKQVLCHPFIVGEIAMGSFAQREVILGDLEMLPQAVIAFDEDVYSFITRHKLFGLGIGYLDAHLLVSAQLTRGTVLWTRDKRLSAIAEKLGLAMADQRQKPN